jgi:release factor glutamine methyltransferase
MACPDLSFATSKDFEHVYEPDSDSWLLMDSLSADLPEIQAASPHICLEIGVGSGAVLTHLAQLLGPNKCAYFGVDINPKATQLARRTGVHNGVKTLETVQMNLVDAFFPRLENAIDILLFNPPYVPTPSEELQGLGIERSWAGGERGREILDKVLPSISVRRALPFRYH